MVEGPGNERGAAQRHAVLGHLRIAGSRDEVDDELRTPGAPARRHGARVLRSHVGKWCVGVLRLGLEARREGGAASVRTGLDADHEGGVGQLDDRRALLLRKPVETDHDRPHLGEGPVWGEPGRGGHEGRGDAGSSELFKNIFELHGFVP